MYYEGFLELLTECEQICNEEAIKMQSIHPYEIISDPDSVIHEAVLSKDNVNKALIAIMQRFEILIKQAKVVAMKLQQKNKGWFESANNFLRDTKDIKLEEYEIYDYLTGIERMKSMGIPKFESIDSGHFENDGAIFKDKSFKEVFSDESYKDENGKEISSPDMKAKAYFRGGVEKKKLNKSEIIAYARSGFSWLKNYQEFLQKILNDSINVNNTFRKTIDLRNKRPITESTILHESLFRDEYYDILLEDALDPNDIKAEENDKNITPIDSNKEENKQSDQNRNTENNMKIWYKTCACILTAKIDICEEAYKAFVDMIDRLMNNVDKKDV